MMQSLCRRGVKRFAVSVAKNDKDASKITAPSPHHHRTITAPSPHHHRTITAPSLHQDEVFGCEWSPFNNGLLATGCGDGIVHFDILTTF